MTPNIAIVHVNLSHGPNFRLWLPLFLAMDSGAFSGAVCSAGLLVGACVSGFRFWRSICDVLGDFVQSAGNGCTGYNRGQSRPRSDSVEVVMNTDRRAIFLSSPWVALQPPRRNACWLPGTRAARLLGFLLSAWRLPAWRNFNLRELLPILMHFFNARIPALAEAVASRALADQRITGEDCYERQQTSDSGDAGRGKDHGGRSRAAARGARSRHHPDGGKSREQRRNGQQPEAHRVRAPSICACWWRPMKI